MYGDSKKKRKGKAGQFEVFNLHSGVVVTFTDDGVNAIDGTANQQRAHAITKLEARDEDGDPVFVPVRPLPAAVLEHDRMAAANRIDSYREIDDKSRSPGFATLRDKYEANAKLRAEYEQRFRDERPQVNPALAPAVAEAQKAAAVEADRAAANTGPRRGRQPKEAPSE